MHFDLPLPPVASAGLMMLSMVEMEAAPGPLGILILGLVGVDCGLVVCFILQRKTLLSAGGIGGYDVSGWIICSQGYRETNAPRYRMWGGGSRARAGQVRLTRPEDGVGLD